MTGLVTQPMKGAEEGGFMGGLMGFGKGVGGAVFKPAAGSHPYDRKHELANENLRHCWFSWICVQGNLRRSPNLERGG